MPSGQRPQDLGCGCPTNWIPPEVVPHRETQEVSQPPPLPPSQGGLQGSDPQAPLQWVHMPHMRRHPGREGLAGRRAYGSAGSCCERQWSVPSPQTRSTAWMPTTGRSRNSSARMPSATRSLGSLKVGTSTAPLAT